MPKKGGFNYGSRMRTPPSKGGTTGDAEVDAHAKFLAERAGGHQGAGTTRTTGEIKAAQPTTAAEKAGTKARGKQATTYGSKPRTGK